MSNSNVRKWLSFLVLFVAGLASLATTQAAPSIEADQSGSTLVGAEGSDLTTSIKLSGFEADSYSHSGRVQFELRGAPGQFEVTSTTQESENARTDPQSFSIELSTADCEASCEFDYQFHIALTDPSAAPVTVPWNLNANVGGTGEIALEIQPLETNPDLLAVVAPPAFGGFVVGLLLSVVLFLRRQHVARGLALAEAATSILLIAGGLFVTSSLTVGLAIGGAGLPMIAVGGCTAFGGVVTRAWLKKPGLWLLPVGGFALPLVLLRLLYSGAFRPTEVVVAMVICGFALAICMMEAAYLLGGLLVRVRARSAHVVLVLGSTAFVVVGSLALSVSIATSVATAAAALLFFIITASAAAFSLWRWLLGDSLNAFIGAVVSLAVSACVAIGVAVGSLLGGSFGGSSDFTLALATISLAIAGVVLAVLTVKPPPLRDPSIQGVALQTNWEIR